MNEFIGKTLRVVEGLDRVLIDDYEKLLADRDAKVGNLAADLVEERAQRRQLAEALVTVTSERDEARTELQCWRLAFGETALKDATDRLREALNEERIEKPGCDSVSSTGRACQASGAHYGWHRAAAGGHSESWPVERIEKDGDGS